MFDISVILFLVAMAFAAVGIINSDKIDSLISKKTAIVLALVLAVLATLLMIFVEKTV